MSRLITTWITTFAMLGLGETAQVDDLGQPGPHFFARHRAVVLLHVGRGVTGDDRGEERGFGRAERDRPMSSKPMRSGTWTQMVPRSTRPPTRASRRSSTPGCHALPLRGIPPAQGVCRSWHYEALQDPMLQAYHIGRDRRSAGEMPRTLSAARQAIG